MSSKNVRTLTCTLDMCPAFLAATAKLLTSTNCGNMREVIELLLEDGEPQLEAEFVGTETVKVA